MFHFFTRDRRLAGIDESPGELAVNRSADQEGLDGRSQANSLPCLRGESPPTVSASAGWPSAAAATPSATSSDARAAVRSRPSGAAGVVRGSRASRLPSMAAAKISRMSEPDRSLTRSKSWGDGPWVDAALRSRPMLDHMAAQAHRHQPQRRHLTFDGATVNPTQAHTAPSKRRHGLDSCALL